MKTLQLTNSLDKRGAGVASVVNTLTQDLNTLGHSTRCFSIQAPNSETNSHPPYDQRFPHTGPIGIGWSRALAHTLRQTASTVDVIHQHGLWSMLSHAVADTRKQCSTPTIISAHGMLEPEALRISAFKKKVFGAFIEKQNLRDAACLHALTKAEATHYRDFGLTRPIAVIPNAIRIPDQQDHGNTVPSTHLPAGRVLLYLSRLHPKKGLPALLHAWKEVLPSNSDWNLMIVGPDENGHKQTLEYTIAQNNIPAATIHDPVYGAEKHQLLARADAFVLPSTSEGFPMAILEAAAHRCPVLQTTTCYFPELAQSGGAIEVEPGPKTLAEGLHKMLELSAEEREYMAGKAHDYVQTHHSPQRITQQFVELYQHVAGSGPAPDFLSG